ncbi:nuclear transport factor 2 isoform X1 [Ziziphus jujuba]|uniref:Nuclear transport factor 2 isoform X1 n=1 Tax=Ziziphus jujuba TaxID=326968 RepID=A0A6P3ZM56_ZIZJJ|nr:nuclear transport factor 2 isoform X1 [Ziziphus jujuba]XP_015879820.3 nuclear transport factor 2 isoform X1 [Ziziphus jujuba]XP_048327529.2 nuclear transport factor 2 isoform X1 [Ziziphus jujuba]
MALQTETPPTAHSAQFVGNAFVDQYYKILHNSPELVYRFYQDSSVISRPDSNGVMTSATTMQGINEKILSFDYKDYMVDIKTADAQKSYKEGVTVLVTGCLTSKDNLKRKFAQSFFLAPQDNGYYVLNDVFRYVEDVEQLESGAVNGVDAAAAPSLISEPEPNHVPDPAALDPATAHEDADQIVVEKAYDASEYESELVNEKKPVAEIPSHSQWNDVTVDIESSSAAALEDAPKKSYASIVKVPKGSLGPTQVYVPTNFLNVSSKKVENQPAESAAPASVPEASAPSSTGTPDSSNTNEEVEGHSIYIRNLPFSVTDAQLEAEFKKFGPIKRGGIQVRNNKQQGYCFGFVEFQSLSSMNSAIQASPITIGGRQAVIEIKRTTTRVGGGGGGRGRYPSGRGGFRSDSFRVRGNYSGGRSFGRNEYGNRGEFSGRGRGPSGRGGDGYQQGRGRGGRPSGPKHNAISA